MKIVDGKMQLISKAEPIEIGDDVWLCGNKTARQKLIEYKMP